MQKNSGVVVPPALVRKLLAELGCHVPEGEDPDIFFVVREDEYEELKLAAAGNSPDREHVEPHAVLLLGCSPSVALTEEMARHRFEVAARNHNEN